MPSETPGAELATLRRLVDALPGVVWSTDRELRVTATRGAGLSRIGSRADRVLGWTIGETLVEATVGPKALEAHERALGGESCSYRIERGDHVFECLVEPIRDDDDAIAGVIGNAVDVTERVAVERALARSEGRLLLALEATGTAVWEWDPATNEAGWSGAFMQMFGLAEDENPETFEDWLAQCVHPDDRELVADVVSRTYAEGNDAHVEHRVVWPDGSLHWLEGDLHAVVGADGSTRALVGATRIIDERKLADDQVQQLADRYRLLFDASPVPMLVYDVETLRYLAVNDAAVRTYGYSKAEFLAMTIADIRPPEDIPAVRKRLAELGNGFADMGVWRHRRKDGAPIDVSIVSAPIVFEGHQGRIVLAQDVTERRRLERQLEQAQRLEALGRLAGGVAHDFNNLLTAISGYGDLALLAEPGSADAEEAVRQILVAAERGSSLTHQLLAFSRHRVAQPEPVGLNDAVAGIAPMLRRLIGERVDLDVVLADGVGHVYVEPGQLDQVILNLVVNAAQAMPDGGALLIATALAELDGDAAREADVSPGEYALLEVSDTGTGMDGETQGHVFEPFFTTKPDGTGLGLSLVYGIVTQQLGHVAVTSEQGVGTTFRVYLPHVQGPAADATLPTASGDAGLAGGERVLLVEDDDAVRGLLERILDQLGYTVRSAASADDVLRDVEDGSAGADLVLTDVVMPGTSGPELVARLRELTPEIRVVFMSGYTGDALEHTGLVESGVPFLEKPFGAQALSEALRAALQGM